jgi:hypothetical protein
MPNLGPDRIPARRPFNERSVLSLTIAFATITYIALSTRAVLNPDEIKYFFDFKRMLSVVVGASIFWFAARSASALLSDQRAQILAALQVSIIGLLCLLLVREAYDFFLSGEMIQRLSANVRWILMWLGYFAGAMATFFALEYHRQIVLLRSLAERTTAKTPVTDKTISATDTSDLRALLVSLHAQTGYEAADPDPRHDEKSLRDCRTTIEQLLCQIDSSKLD